MERTLFRYRFETQGERLYAFVREWMSDPFPRFALSTWCERSGMPEEWTEYIEQFAAIALTGRIVAAGRSIKRRHGNDQVLYRQVYRRYLNDHLLISKSELNDLVNKAISAVNVAEGEISNSIRKDRRAWAASKHRHCYMCEVELNFKDDKSDSAYTLEHLWPSSYGGDSIEENLLPACAVCNRSRKSNFVTWATTSVQSVLRTMDSDVSDPHFISGTTKFALHHWAGQRYAISQNTNLQSAFLKIGPWVEPRVLDDGDVIHFFNLRNHSEEITLH